MYGYNPIEDLPDIVGVEVSRNMLEVMKPKQFEDLSDILTDVNTEIALSIINGHTVEVTKTNYDKLINRLLNSFDQKTLDSLLDTLPTHLIGNKGASDNIVRFTNVNTMLKGVSKETLENRKEFNRTNIQIILENVTYDDPKLKGTILYSPFT